MSWYTDMLTQIATYWPPAGKDAFGNIIYGAYQSIVCRWEDTQEIYVTATGQEKRSTAKVFVNADLENNGYLFKGSSIAADPRTVSGAWLIQKFDKIPSIAGDEFERKAWL